MFLKVLLVCIVAQFISFLAFKKFLKIKSNPFKRYEYFNERNKELIRKLQKVFFITIFVFSIIVIILKVSTGGIITICYLIFIAVYNVITGLDQLEAEPDKKEFIISFVDSGICIGLAVMLIIEIIR
ncbi:MAG: hypothetical protein K0S51_1138 [Bacillales bacterium]|jgi:hypothetical protein|nr:hypothetical protein [Bacillales bacterium]